MQSQGHIDMSVFTQQMTYHPTARWDWDSICQREKPVDTAIKSCVWTGSAVESLDLSKEQFVNNTNNNRNI